MTMSSVLKFLGNLIMYSFGFAFYGQLLIHKLPKRAALASCVAAAVLSDLIGMMELLPGNWNAVRTLGTIGLMAGFVLIAFRGSLVRKLLLVVMQFVVIGAAEVVGLVIVTRLGFTARVQELPPMVFLLLLTIDLIIQGALLYGGVIVVKRFFDHVDTKSLTRFLFYPLSQFLMLDCFVWALIPGNDDGLAPRLVVFLAVALLADVALLATLHSAREQREQEALNRTLVERERLQMEHYRALEAQYNGIRKLRHDIVSHLHTLQILTDRGEAERAGQYAEALLHSYEELDVDGQEAQNICEIGGQ